MGGYRSICLHHLHAACPQLFLLGSRPDLQNRAAADSSLVGAPSAASLSRTGRTYSACTRAACST